MNKRPTHSRPARESSKLPINLEDLLRQRTVESDRIEYEEGERHCIAGIWRMQ